MKDAENESLKSQSNTDWAESLKDLDREDWSTFDNLVERSLQLSKRLLYKADNEDFFSDLVMNFY